MSIFSLEDIRDIVLSFPTNPSRNSLDGEQTPILIPSASNDGFFQPDFISEQLQQLLNDNSGRLAVSSLARSLDIRIEDAHRIIRKRKKSVLLSQKFDQVLCRDELLNVDTDLAHEASYRFVPLDRFCESHDINSLNFKAYLEVDGEPRNTTGTHYQLTHDRFLYIPQVKDQFEKELDASLQDSQLQASPLTWDLNSGDFRGLDELAFHKTVQDILEKKPREEAHGKILRTNHGLTWHPQSYLEKRLNETLDEVKAGIIPLCGFDWINDHSLDDLKNPLDMRAFLESRMGHSCYFVDELMVSKAWEARFVSTCSEELQQAHYLDISEVLGTELRDWRLPPKWLEDLKNNIFLHLQEAPRAVMINHHIILKDWLVERQYEAKQYATDQATSDWTSNAVPSNDAMKYHLLELEDKVVSELNLPEDFVEAITPIPFHPAIREAYTTQLSQLESENEKAFLSYWKERASTRVQLHFAALATLEDGTLKDQLADLLYGFVAHDLVPTTLKKAEAKGLLRSAKVLKQTEKLKDQISSIPPKDPQASLAAFARKFNLRPPTASALSLRQKTLVLDMAKPVIPTESTKLKKDDPKLFLTAVIVLLAESHDGVFYATGKFAPKLLKLLKPKITDAEYERLQRFKDAVKKGQAEETERENIREMIRKRIPEGSATDEDESTRI
ncbi:hypothetical protein K402DRAFT_406532 [Aulographum hederae CBS 113979]|uniref:Uncharacterized protein n=1 Tax=Aulographum hederae CBS 113979 TaxID=1176131 RepID=A0A6G1GS99_9PEZI|nr:hypothetical protein K402DRAFT_406532 [Aulographum hederae CBS 113979]